MLHAVCLYGLLSAFEPADRYSQNWCECYFINHRPSVVIINYYSS
jgi:hypothetical protein